MEEKYFELQDSLQLIRNSNRINQNIFQVNCLMCYWTWLD